jgi:transposase
MLRKGAGGRPSRSLEKLMLGIDVSKADLVCTLLDPTTRQNQWTRTFPNTAAGIRHLLTQTPADPPWVLEPTGRFSTSVVKQAQAEGRTLLLAPPRQAQRFLQAIQTRAKTDRLDSAGLALFDLSMPLKPYPIKPDAVEQLEQLLTARHGIVQAITSLQPRIAELPHAAAPLQKAVADLKTQREELDRQIRALTQKQEPLAALVASLQSVPGIGPVTATSIAARLTSKEFGHPDQFVAYIGLDVAVRQSGKREGKCGLTKQGDGELRRLLYLCARANLRVKESPFRTQYERERERGLSKTAALNAVARKLARLCWSLAKHGTSYDPDRVHKQG